MPDQETKSGSWVSVIVGDSVPNGLPMHFCFAFYDKGRVRGRPPLISVLIYLLLLLFIMTFLLKVFYVTKSRVGRRSVLLPVFKKEEKKKKLASSVYLNAFFTVLFCGFFLWCILCTLKITGRYCNNTGTFHPPRYTEGNSSEEVIRREIQQQLQVAFSTCVSVLNSTFTVLYYMVLRSSSYRSATAVCKEVTISSVHLYSTKKKAL